MNDNLSKILSILKKKRVYILGAIVFLVLFIPFILTPSLTGFAAYQDMEDQGGNVKDYTKSMDELLSTTENLETEITFCEDNSEELKKEIKGKDDEIILHLSNIELLTEKVTELEKNIEDLKKSYQDSIDKLIQEHNNEKVKIRQENDDEIEDLEQENQDKLEDLEQENDDEIENLETEIDDLNSQIDSLQEQIDDTADEISRFEIRYNTLAQNSANNICCKMKYDNSNIGYYELVNNKIICLETGTQTINCDI